MRCRRALSAQFGVAELTDGTITAAVCVPKDIASLHPMLYSDIEPNLATEYLGNGWLQFVPGAEAGGSGAGGLCRDMLRHVSEDVPQHHQVSKRVCQLICVVLQRFQRCRLMLLLSMLTGNWRFVTIASNRSSLDAQK